MPKKRLTSDIRKRMINRLAAKYGNKCCYCDCQLTKEIVTLEHVVAISFGGTNRMDNLRLSCEYCNAMHMNPREMHMRPKHIEPKHIWYAKRRRKAEKRSARGWCAPCLAIA